MSLRQRRGGPGRSSPKRRQVPNWIKQRKAAAPPLFEPLEDRFFLSAATPAASLSAVPYYQVVKSGLGSPVGLGFTPAMMTTAYGTNQITYVSAGQTIVGNGAGQTIAIVDAYDDPNIVTDLETFDQAFGISNDDAEGNFVLTKVKEASYVPQDVGWDGEISLDVEWAHAVAPGAHILLVEAPSSSFQDLFAAVNYARNYPGVVAVSMSFGTIGGDDDPSLLAFDSTFTTPPGHIGGSGIPGGITFVASTGDYGAPAGYPSTSPNVVAAGGTSLYTDTLGGYLNEVGWAGSGGGPSSIEPLPAYQAGVANGSAMRLTPDVAYDADPNTGVPIYDSVADPDDGIAAGWSEIGGTSAASPQWAALFAIADQGRALEGKGSLDGPTQTLPGLYSLPSADFHEILTGDNGGEFGTGFAAGPGYNEVTGLGTPVANLLIPALVALPQVSPSTYGPAALEGGGFAASPSVLAAKDRLLLNQAFPPLFGGGADSGSGSDTGSDNTGSSSNNSNSDGAGQTLTTVSSAPATPPDPSSATTTPAAPGPATPPGTDPTTTTGAAVGGAATVAVRWSGAGSAPVGTAQASIVTGNALEAPALAWADAAELTTPASGLGLLNATVEGGLEVTGLAAALAPASSTSGDEGDAQADAAGAIDPAPDTDLESVITAWAAGDRTLADVTIDALASTPALAPNDAAGGADNASPGSDA